jgi:hypothetical protein
MPTEVLPSQTYPTERQQSPPPQKHRRSFVQEDEIGSSTGCDSKGAEKVTKFDDDGNH